MPYDDYLTENGKKYFISLQMEMENEIMNLIQEPSDHILKVVGANAIMNRIFDELQKTPQDLFAVPKEESKGEKDESTQGN